MDGVHFLINVSTISYFSSDCTGFVSVEYEVVLIWSISLSRLVLHRHVSTKSYFIAEKRTVSNLSGRCGVCRTISYRFCRYLW